MPREALWERPSQWHKGEDQRPTMALSNPPLDAGGVGILVKKSRLRAPTLDDHGNSDPEKGDNAITAESMPKYLPPG